MIAAILFCTAFMCCMLFTIFGNPSNKELSTKSADEILPEPKSKQLEAHPYRELQRVVDEPIVEVEKPKPTLNDRFMRLFPLLHEESIRSINVWFRTSQNIELRVKLQGGIELNVSGKNVDAAMLELEKNVVKRFQQQAARINDILNGLQN